MKINWMYKANNGYYGTFKQSTFLGYKHYDLTIRLQSDNSMVYHATYSEAITFAEFREQVEDFPTFYKVLLKMEEKSDE